MNRRSRSDEVLDYFFKSIYREGDRVILADQSRSIEINTAAEKETRVDEFKAGVAAIEQGSALGQGTVQVADRVVPAGLPGLQVNGAQKRISPRCDPNTVVLQYEQLLREYRLQNQKPNVDRLEAMTRSLEAVDADKWALVFFQHDILPLFDIEKMKVGDNHIVWESVLRNSKT